MPPRRDLLARSSKLGLTASDSGAWLLRQAQDRPLGDAPFGKTGCCAKTNTPKLSSGRPEGCSESRIKIFSVTMLGEVKRPQIQLSEPEGRVLDWQWSRALALSKRDFEKRRAPSGLQRVDKDLGRSPKTGDPKNSLMFSPGAFFSGNYPGAAPVRRSFRCP